MRKTEISKQILVNEGMLSYDRMTCICLMLWSHKGRCPFATKVLYWSISSINNRVGLDNGYSLRADSSGSGHYGVGCSETAIAEEKLAAIVNTGSPKISTWLLLAGSYPKTVLSIPDRSDKLWCPESMMTIASYSFNSLYSSPLYHKSPTKPGMGLMFNTLPTEPPFFKDAF